ncbi:MAG TPA: VWA domain-containing protein [Oscillatoriaceae cyanobacterium M33_DOE_052]|nr:VWA domain-containing protein [Oscillatoriaceae cyanobacterium M33_DOE_052]
MTTALNHVDLCFVVDTTGSMGAFIHTAQQQLLHTIGLLSADSSIDLKIGLVEYRDHPPQDPSFVTRLYQLTANLKEMQKAINKLTADGGGDGPEAVYRGVHDACEQMKWRPHSCRFILLVGDAPPHGFSAWLREMAPTERLGGGNHGDAWPDGCPSGLNVQSVTGVAENQRVTVHALCMGGDLLAMRAFSAIASGTGGQAANAANAKDVISQMVAMLGNEFRDLAFDKQVLEAVLHLGTPDSGSVAETLAIPRLQAAAAIARLGKRGFLNF